MPCLKVLVSEGSKMALSFGPRRLVIETLDPFDEVARHGVKGVNITYLIVSRMKDLKPYLISFIVYVPRTDSHL